MKKLIYFFIHFSPNYNLIGMVLKMLLKTKHLLPMSCSGPGRFLSIYEDDIFIVSYPKSGNTWVRFLVANLLTLDREIGFHNIEDLVPDIYRNSDASMVKLKKPRILKSHEYFDPRIKKAIYITRDPRDVITSLYHFMIKLNVIEDNYPEESFMKRFFRGEFDACFGSWGENVGSWLGARENCPDFLLLRYEDIMSDPEKEVKRIAHFLNRTAAEREIKSVIKLSSFDNMRKLEKINAHQWISQKNSKPDRPFVRRARVGDWKNFLSNRSLEQIENKWGKLMRTLGYS